jgi:hypothetical protein
MERHLEPNQKASFRAAMSELANAVMDRRAPSATARHVASACGTPATIAEPDEDEVAEPPSGERNRERTILRLAGSAWFRTGLTGLCTG